MLFTHLNNVYDAKYRIYFIQVQLSKCSPQITAIPKAGTSTFSFYGAWFPVHITQNLLLLYLESMKNVSFTFGFTVLENMTFQ